VLRIHSNQGAGLHSRRVLCLAVFMLLSPLVFDVPASACKVASYGTSRGNTGIA
jgi:hypothetical protein